MSYGIPKKPGDDWEVDHLISLELGGSNSIRNLWPESGSTQPLNYHIKDKLENALHDLVCGGQLSLEDAQKGIATNWALLYKTWIGNLKDGTDPSTVVDPLSPHIIPSSPSTNPVSSSRGVPPYADGSCPASSPIKVSRSGIYHVPGSTFYDRTKAVLCFDSEQHAKDAGYRAPR